MGITLLPDLTRSDSVLTRQAGLTEKYCPGGNGHLPARMATHC